MLIYRTLKMPRRSLSLYKVRNILVPAAAWLRYCWSIFLRATKLSGPSWLMMLGKSSSSFLVCDGRSSSPKGWPLPFSFYHMMMVHCSNSETHLQEIPNLSVSLAAWDSADQQLLPLPMPPFRSPTNTSLLSALMSQESQTTSSNAVFVSTREPGTKYTQLVPETWMWISGTCTLTCKLTIWDRPLHCQPFKMPEPPVYHRPMFWMFTS
jgi:hypothetical protein